MTFDTIYSIFMEHLMSKLGKILKKWESRPKEVNKNEVIGVLKRFNFELEFKPGSHIIVRHKKLENKHGFGSLGEFTVPIKNGRYVKGFYLRTILIAIMIIQEADKNEN